MEQIFLAYSLPKVTAIMMLYGNRKVKFRSPDGDIVAGVLQEDTLDLYL